MNKEDIKKAFDICYDIQQGCTDCPLLKLERQNGAGCKYNLFVSVIDLITEQEKEIEQFKTSNQNAIDKINELQKEINALQEENRRLDEYVSCTLSAQEFDEEIKQAKIDVLNELKRQAEHCDQWNCEVVPTRYIDEMIEEVE